MLKTLGDYIWFMAQIDWFQSPDFDRHEFVDLSHEAGAGIRLPRPWWKFWTKNRVIKTTHGRNTVFFKGDFPHKHSWVGPDAREMQKMYLEMHERGLLQLAAIPMEYPVKARPGDEGNPAASAERNGE